LRSAADEITLIREQHRNRILTLPFVICYFGYMLFTIITKYLSPGGNWTNLTAAFVFLLFIGLSAFQIYVFYKWRQAEIYQDVRSYLSLSAKILRGHMAMGKRGYLIFLPIMPVVLAMVYSRVEHTLFYFIVAVFTLAIGIAFYMQPAFNKKLYDRYTPILTNIDSILSNMDDAI
jgi:hypothetical protein